jgi:hypothetical protein
MVKAVNSYNLYNTPQELRSPDNPALPLNQVQYENGQLVDIQRGLPVLLNPDLRVTEFQHRIHADTTGGLEMYAYDVASTELDPPLTYYWPNDTSAMGFLSFSTYRHSTIDCTVLETWNLIYGRLPMMRHRYKHMGYGGRRTIQGGQIQYDITHGGIFDTLVFAQSYFSLLDGELSAAIADPVNRPSLWTTYVNRFFTDPAALSHPDAGPGADAPGDPDRVRGRRPGRERPHRLPARRRRGLRGLAHLG